MGAGIRAGLATGMAGWIMPRRADSSNEVLLARKQDRGGYILYPKLHRGINLLVYMYYPICVFHSRTHNIVQNGLCNERSYISYA